MFWINEYISLEHLIISGVITDQHIWIAVIFDKNAAELIKLF